MYLPLAEAVRVFQLYGYEWKAAGFPSADKPITGRLGYHLRSGKHDVTQYDWEHYLHFSDKHLK